MTSIQQKLVILIYITSFIVITVAEEENVNQSNTTSMERSDVTARKKLKFLYPFGLGFGGFHALAALVAIKFKVLLIAIFVFGAIFYGIRIWAGKGIGCPEPSILKEPFYPHGLTAYSHTSPEYYYPNVGSSNGIYYSHPSYSSSDIATAPGYPGTPTISNTPGDILSGPYKRKGRSTSSKAETSRQASTRIDFAEIVFSFLNVDTVECKRRFVCEVDYLSRRDPWIRMGYRMLGYDLFKKYRTSESLKISKYRECLKLYENCKTPTEKEAHKVSYVEVKSGNSTKTNGTKF